MSVANQPPARYSSAAILLHWVLAALLLFQLSLGWRLERLANVPQFIAFQLHKSIGILILLLSLARLGIRLAVPRPAPVAASPALSFLASATHALLYVVMIAGPITGWIMVSTATVRVQTLLFDLVPWPHLPLGHGWHEPAEVAHAVIAWLFVALVVLHVAGALRHHMLRDDLLGRMMPRAVTSRRNLTIGALVALLGCGVALAAAKIWPFPAPPPRTAPDIELTVAMGADADEALANATAALPAPANAASEEQQAAEETETAAAATPWRVQAGGKLGFRADYSGMPIEGSFKRWDADIVFDPEDLPGSTISVTIDLASVDSADSERDAMLASDSFFNVAAHPHARFRSSRITHRTGNAYRAAGSLTLHGQSKPVTLDFTLDIKGDEAKAAGTATLSRTAFGIGSGQWSSTDDIKDAVAVTFSFTAKRAPR